jgi:hypothetical protein
MDKPKIELCGDNDPDCEMGNMKVRALGIRAGQALCSPPCVCVGSAPACLLVLSVMAGDLVHMRDVYLRPVGAGAED